jgi:hypothetical protein
VHIDPAVTACMARQGFDVSAIASSPALLGSFVLAIPGWFTAFIAQIIVRPAQDNPLG